MKLSSLPLLLAMVPALAVACPPAHARTRTQVTRQIDGQLLDLGVYDRDSGQALPVYRHDGRYYVAGVPGHRYQLSLRNHSGGEVLGIVSVDGINAISGSTADWSQDDGYVLHAGSSYEVKGWRKSKAQVAGFVFADADNSYASRTGRPGNVGVIGVAVFRSLASMQPLARDEVSAPAPPEFAGAPPPVVIPSTAASGEAKPAPAPGMRADMASRPADTGSPLGTGFGQRELDQVHDVDFQRASSVPDEVLTLYYDTRAHLVARGVLPRLPPRGEPEPFPGQRFVPDPPARDSR